MTKVSLPVILAEPLNALQRSVEIMSGWSLIELITEANMESDDGQDTSKASCKRLIGCALLQVAHFIS
jgi:hypothetical protein